MHVESLFFTPRPFFAGHPFVQVEKLPKSLSARSPSHVAAGQRGTSKLQLGREISGLSTVSSYFNMSDFYLKVEFLVLNYSMYYKVN